MGVTETTLKNWLRTDKITEPAVKAAVEQLKQEFAFSERRACGVLGLAVSTFRYRSVRCDQPLRDKLVELAREKPRFGYRRLHVLSQRDGVRVNHKKVWRVYQAAGLGVKRKRRKRSARVGTPALPVT